MWIGCDTDSTTTPDSSTDDACSGEPLIIRTLSVLSVFRILMSNNMGDLSDDFDPLDNIMI